MFRRDDKRRSYAGGEAPVHSSALAAASALGRALHPDGKSVDHSKIPIYNQPSRSASVMNMRPKAPRPTVQVRRNGSVRKEQTPERETVSAKSKLRNSSSTNDMRGYRRASSLPTKMRTSTITKKEKNDANAAFDGFDGHGHHAAAKHSSQGAVSARPRTVRKYIPGPNGLMAVDVPVREDTGADVYVPKKVSNSSLRRSQSMNRVLSDSSSKENLSHELHYKRSPNVRHSLTKKSEDAARSTRHHVPKSNDKLATHSKRAASLTNKIKSQFATPIIETSMEEENEDTIKEESLSIKENTPPPIIKKRTKSKKRTQIANVEPEMITTDIDDLLDGDVPQMPRSSSGETELDFSDEFPDFANDTLPSNYDTIRPMVMEDDKDEASEITDVNEQSNTDLTETESEVNQENDKLPTVQAKFVEAKNTTTNVAEHHNDPKHDDNLIAADGSEVNIKITTPDGTGIPASTGTLVNSEASDVDLGLMSRAMENNSTVTSVEVEQTGVLAKGMTTFDEITEKAINIPANQSMDNGDSDESGKHNTTKSNMSPQHIELSSSNDMTYDEETSENDGLKLATTGSVGTSETESEKERSALNSDTSTIQKPTEESELNRDVSRDTENVAMSTVVESTSKDKTLGVNEEKNTKTSDIVSPTQKNDAQVQNTVHTSKAPTDASFSTPPPFPSETFTPASGASSYMTTNDDIDLKNSVEDIIDAMDKLDPELDSILTSPIEKTKKVPHTKNEVHNRQKLSDKGKTKISGLNLKKQSIPKEVPLKTPAKSTKPISVGNPGKRKATSESKPAQVTTVHPEKLDSPSTPASDNKKKNSFAQHLRSANPYLSIPPKSAKRLADKEKLQKKAEMSLDDVTIKSRGEVPEKQENRTITSSAVKPSNTKLKVPPPKQQKTKVVTPIKSALKSSSLDKSNTSSVYSDYSPAKGAYLSLTTAENTRLNSQIPDNIAPPKKVTPSPRFARPQSMVARVGNRSESPTPKEKTKLNRNSTIGRLSHNETIRPVDDSHIQRRNQAPPASQNGNVGNRGHLPSTKKITRSNSTSQRLNERKQSTKLQTSLPRSASVYSKIPNTSNKKSTTSTNGIDPDLVGILYPKEPLPKKSSFEKLRNGEVHLGFKKMSLREEIMQDAENANTQQSSGQASRDTEEENELTGLYKSTGWTSRFQDSDSDDDFMPMVSKPTSPSKDTKTKVSNGFSLFKGKPSSENAPVASNTPTYNGTPSTTRQPQAPPGYSGTKSHMTHTGLRSSSTANYPHESQQMNNRAVSDSVQPSSTGRLSGRSLVPPPKENDDGKKSKSFGKKLKKIFGRRKSDM